ncbi:zinc dependent phospholipase C family protein [Bacillus cereus]|uniref:zinc dependent phospholipase C family protein n=1 Tax=Bacillus cereus TaxID=1396 RepID=UPI000BF49EE9|nr:zinc dependent phospholipase C family protein [Bacillus cereus]PEQ60942.1 phospholipase [Bacillus cereus]
MNFSKKICTLALTTVLSSIAITIVPSEILGDEINQNNATHSREKRWSAEAPNNVEQSTHLWMAQNAINIMARDQDAVSRRNAVNFFNQPNLKRAFEQGLYDADHLDEFNNGGMGSIYIDGYIKGGWKSHFYNPDTGKNYKGETKPTAKTEGTKYFELAGDYYKNGNQEKAMYFLGVATHYFTDITQPMHAANFTNVELSDLDSLKFHSVFEDYVTEIQEHYKVDDALGEYNILLTNKCSEYSYDAGDWIHAAAIIAKAQAPNIIRPEVFRENYGHILVLPDFSIQADETWKRDPKIQEAIAKSLIEGQRMTAGFLNVWFEKFVGNTPS